MWLSASVLKVKEGILTQSLQDLKKKTSLHAALMKVERRVDTRVVEVVLHQPVMSGCTVSIDVSLMLCSSPGPRGRPGFISASIIVFCSKSNTSHSVISMSDLNEDNTIAVYWNETSEISMRW